MIRKILVITMLVLLAGVLLAGAFNRTQAKSNDNGETLGRGKNGYLDTSPEFTSGQYGEQGNGLGRQGYVEGYSNVQAGQQITEKTSDLSSEEMAALFYMREEEKLAHDVYLTLYERWGLDVFQNISNSEQTHMDAIKNLLDRYGLSDPAQKDVGAFSDQTLQELYDELVVRGSQSLAEALKVGAAIEEIDILDLRERIARTDKSDIQRVFSNLLRGSGNHLRAFVNELITQTGEIYEPQYLTVDEYQSIISGASQTGGWESRGGGGGGYRGGRP